MATNPSLTKCLIGEARVNFPRLFTPEAFNGSEPHYQVTLSFPKEDTALYDKIQKAISECKEKAAAMFGGKLPKNFNLPNIKDGDEDYETDGYAGLWTIKLKSKSKPELVKKATVMGKTQLVHITDEDELYAGCYCFASVTFFAYDTPTSKGISCWLNSVLKSRDGERFEGGSRENAEDVYASVMNDIEETDYEDVF